jgi:hypothetical protein
MRSAGEAITYQGENMKKLICAAALAVALAGCVSAPIKTVDSANALQGKTIILSEYAKPDFSAMTAGKAMFGMFGAAAMVAAGNDLVKKDGIADPSLAVSEKLAQDLKSARGEKLLLNNIVIAADDNVSTLLKDYPGADLIIDVKTLNWMYSYYPTKWDKYHVFYSARLRVLDGKTGDLVAQAICKADPTDANNPPTKDQLLANEGELLKSLLQKAGDNCVKIYEKQILNV